MLTSTTAPGKTFSSRGDLADHYKSDWHKYNLKRREAGLPLLGESDFQARWEAALALRQEKERSAQAGTDHLKGNKRKKSKKKSSEASPAGTTAAADGTTATAEQPPTKSKAQLDIEESQENPEINPKQCLFDAKTFDTIEENVDYMLKTYGFFIPDQECLVDKEGLLGYCQEKIKLGHYCLYCEKVFPTWQSCQQHMVSTQHTKLRYEEGFWDELDPFYDFKRENSLFLGEMEEKADTAVQPMDEDGADDDDEGGWEDMSEGEDEDEEMYEGYEKEIAQFGLDVTPLGELVFPDGRIIGHRGLARYYKQRFRPQNTSTALVAAKRAAGDRLFEGKVVNVGQPMAGSETRGAGKGILVGLKDGAEGFSALSLYRYRAAIKKQRRDDDMGRRLYHRTKLNINRMDKKHNRLMNGVSVAHAAR